MGSLGLALRLSVRNLLLHKLRSLLTVLGLVFGVSSVVAMLAVAEGAGREAERQLAELGATNIIIRSIKPLEEANASRSEDSFVFSYGLTRLDSQRIRETLPTVRALYPMREHRQEIRNESRALDAQVLAVTPEHLELSSIRIAKGRFLTETDEARTANRCVIGHDAAAQLFPLEDPIGRAIRIGEFLFFEVVGVTDYKAPSAAAGSSGAAVDYNRQVYIPIATDRARVGDTLFNDKQGSFSAERIELSQITVAVRDMEEVRPTADALESLLAAGRTRTDYAITVPLELLEKAEATRRLFSAVLASIAGISLLVGGIGIMNIMLATVTERTREIGIRRALGAKRRDIIRQFLIETAVLSAVGGGLGVALGLAAPLALTRFTGVPAVVEPWTSPLAFGIAMATGVLFGVYPARRAAAMDPVEALRSE
jgi:putative ABC transport system permease protein